MSRVLLRNAVSALWFIAKTLKMNLWQVVEITFSVDTFFVLDSAQPTNVIGRYKNFFSCTAWFEYLFQFNTPSFPYSGRERDKKWIAYESCTFVIESTCHFHWGGPLFSLKLNPPFQTPACYEMHIPLVCNSFLSVPFLWIAELKFFVIRIAWEIMTN